MKTATRSLSLVSAGMLLGLSPFTGATQAAEGGSIEAGREASRACAACHGADGNSSSPAFPSIAGQPAGYLAAQLIAYREGDRENAIMSPQAANLSDEQIRDIAAFFAAQERKASDPARSGSERGSRLYHHGQDGVPACAACHGAEGAGNQPAGFPAMRGMSADYIARSLKDYRDQQRKGGNAIVMYPIASNLSDEDIDALAAHIATLD
jgi:cytochrome c553